MTRQRLRAYATVIALCLWTIWLIDITRPGPIDWLGKVKGTDFIHFYVIGSVARDGAWTRLFDVRAQHDRMQTIVSDPPLYVPVESPQTALLMAPFTQLSYTTALGAWVALILLVYAGCCWTLWRLCPSLRDYRREFVAACAGFPGLFSVVLHGQTSFLVLVCVVGSLVALRLDRRFIAGLALGLLVFKPHWLLAAGAVLLFSGEWRALAGAALAAAAETAATWMIVGTSVISTYLRMLRSLPALADLLEPAPGDSLKGLFKVFVVNPHAALVLYALASLAALIVAARIWRTDSAFELRASAFVLALMLVSPHANNYDLVLIGPVLLMMAAWIERADDHPQPMALRWLLVVLFVAPLATSLPAWIRLQFSVTAMATLLAMLWRCADPSGARVFLRGIVPPRAEWPTTALPSTSENASVVTPARLRARPSIKSRSGSIAAG